MIDDLEDVIFYIEAIIIGLVVLYLYLNFLQPFLAGISGIFSMPSNPSTGRYPDSVAGLVYIIIYVIILITYQVGKVLLLWDGEE